jgi:ligand-binding sensor domain-containing protein
MSAIMLLIEASHLAHSQDSISFRRIGEREGLTQGTITSIVEDRDGFIWFSNQDGINRYDGYSIETVKHGLGDLNVIKICAGDSSLLVITGSGISLYDLHTRTFKNFGQQEPILGAVNVSGVNFVVARKKDVSLFDASTGTFGKIFLTENIRGIVGISSTKVLVLSRKRVYLIDIPSARKDTLFVLPGSEEFRENVLAKVHNGNILAATTKQQVCLINTETRRTAFLSMNGVPITLTSPITALEQDRTLRYWIGTTKGIILQSGSESRILQNGVCDSESLSYDDVNTIFRDSKSRLWIGTNGAGLNLYHPFRNVFKKVMFLKGDKCFGNEYIWSILRDGKQLLLGTRNEGLVEISLEKKAPFARTIESVNAKEVWTIAKDPMQGYLIGTSNGLFVGGKLEKLAHTTALGDSVYIITRLGSYWYAGSNEGISIFSNWSASRRIPNTEFLGKIYSIIDVNGIIYCAAATGLYIVDPQKGAKLLHRERVLAVQPVPRGSGKLYLGTAFRGLVIFDPITKSIDPLNKVNDGGASAIYAIQLHGNVAWASSNRGLLRLPLESQNYLRITSESGLLINEFNANASFRDKDGYLYFGGVEGFQFFSPEDFEIVYQQYHTPVKLSEFSIVNRNQEFSTSDVIEAKYNDVLNIRLSSLDFMPNEVLEYRIVITNALDTTIHALDTTFRGRNTFQYPVQLPRGEYTVQIMSRTILANSFSDPPQERKLRTGYSRSLYIFNEYTLWVVIGLVALALGAISLAVWAVSLALSYRRAKESANSQNNLLNQEKRDIADLQKIINDISRIKDIDSICRVAIGHVTDKFGFNYARISVVDPLTNEKRVQQRRDQKLIDDQYANIRDTIEKFGTTSDTFGQSVHLLIDSQRQTENSRIGSVEIGHFGKIVVDDKNSSLQSRVGIFFDNCSQVLSEAYQETLKETTRKLLKDHSTITDPREYRNKMLDETCKLIKADFAFLAFTTYNVNDLIFGHSTDRAIIDADTTKFFNNELRYLKKEVLEKKVYQIRRDHNDLSFKSSLAVPLVHEDRVFAIAVYYSTAPDHFNNYHPIFLTGVWTKAVRNAFRLKLWNTIARLVEPSNLYSHQNETFRTIIEQLGTHLRVKYAGIWLFEPASNGTVLKFKYGSKQLQDIPKITETNFLDQKYFEDLNVEGPRVVPCKDFLTGRLNETSNIVSAFSSVLIEPILVESSKSGYVLIFSKSDAQPLYTEDKLIIQSIVSKGSLTSLAQNLFESFASISLDVPVKEDLLLNKVSIAADTTKADQVLIFWQTKELLNSSRFEVLTYGDLNSKDKKSTRDQLELDDKDNFISTLIEKELLQLYSLKSFLGLYPDTNEHVQKYFGNEKIRKIIVLQLSYNSGILIFSHKQDIKTDDEFLKLLRVLGFTVSNTLKEIEIHRQADILKKTKLEGTREAMEGKLARDMVHNVNTHVGTVNFWFSKLRDKSAKKVEKEEIDKFINNAGPALMKLRNSFDTLNGYRTRVGRDEKIVKIWDLIDRSIDLMALTADRRNIELKFDKKSSTPNIDITCIEDKVVTVIINLIMNSVEAIEHYRRDGKVTIRTIFEPNYIVIIISDNGPGIDNAIKGAIFNSSFTTKEFGTGIGLSSAKEFIEIDHHGKIELMMNYSDGATFGIYLPLN